jgi:hypothetical protein
MQFSINKAKTTAIFVTVLMMTSIALLTTSASGQLVAGQTGGTPDDTSVWSTTVPAGQTAAFTFNPVPYVSVSPTTIGIGQTLLVNMWCTPPPAANRYLAGYTVTLKKPDGTTDKVGPLHSYVADGTCWFEYVVDQVGQWQIQFSFPGEFFPAGSYLNGRINGTAIPGVGGFGGGSSTYPAEYYSPATTDWSNFTVQSQPVMSWYSPLPTDLWTRPISLNNREWYSIAGNYPWTQQSLGSSMSSGPRFLGPYIQGSPTAHIVWSRQDGFPAGIIGGEGYIYGNKASATTPSLIFEGRAYATQTVQWYNGSFLSCAVCYDLRTGKMYYEIPTAAPYYGITPTFIDYVMGTTAEVAGAGDTNTITAYLRTISGTGTAARLYAINPNTGAISQNYTAISGTYHNGWVISFQTVNASASQYRLINWTTNGTNATYVNVVSNISSVFGSLSQVDWTNDVSVQQGRFVYGNVDGGYLRGYSLLTGQQLFWFNTTETPFNPGFAVADQGMYFCGMENRFVEAFNTLTGALVWKSPLTDYPWGDFWGYLQASAYGVFVGFGYTGIYAFNWTTGQIVWHFTAPAPAFETPYSYNGTNDYSFTGSPLIANGILYIDNNEHTPSAPYTRGWGFYAVNMTDGSLIWKVDEPMVAGAMADGYTTASDSYDGTMYVFGKGPSETTIETPLTAITQGQSVVIKGSVTDQSPAQPGAACVSEASMGAYMSYLHLQSQLQNSLHPDAPTGVPVSIDAIDPKGNYVHVGDTTTDVSGAFSFKWTPDQVGKYTVTATFTGSPSYGSSFAESAVGVDAAPATNNNSNTNSNVSTSPDNTNLLYGILGAVVVAIILAIVAIAVVLRKK